MDVVKAIEAVGSQGGETSKKVSITDCGEIKFGEDGFFDLPGTSAWSNHGPSIEYYVVLSSVVMFIILICIARKKILKISKRNSRYLKFRVKREDSLVHSLPPPCFHTRCTFFCL